MKEYNPNTNFLLYKTESGELNDKVVCSILELTTQHGAIQEKSKPRQQNFTISMKLNN